MMNRYCNIFLTPFALCHFYSVEDRYSKRFQASTDGKDESQLTEYKKQAKLIFRRLNSNSEERASIESGPFVLQFLLHILWQANFQLPDSR